MASPSFREEPSAEAEDGLVVSSAAHDETPQQIPEPPSPDDDPGDESDDDDFEFAFVIKDPQTGPDITADEIFCNGQIRPIYPVFDRALLLADDAPAAVEEGEGERAPAVRVTLRRLFIEEREGNPGSSSASSSAEDELARVPPGTYCVWTPRSATPSPSPARCKKSRSTGSALRWRLRDLVVGRSRSDGKEKFVFLSAERNKKKETRTAVAAQAEANKKKESPSRAAKDPTAATEEAEKRKAKGKGKGKGGKVTVVDVVTTRRVYYGKGGGGGGQAAGGAAPRSFLPYKQDLLGFFANVNGLSRTHHPF